jgi:prepilin-type N-terminal cleavage/methylation domain-containing protein
LTGDVVRTASSRSGVTLIELLLVLAILVLLAAVTLPSLTGLKGNSEQQAAVDQMRGRIADARGLAMQEAVPYRLALSSDGKKIRVAPDTPEFGSVACSDEATGGAKTIETTLTMCTVELEASVDEGEASPTEDSWVTVATFLPNGTCREVLAVVRVMETGFPPIRIQIRGLTGTSTVLSNDPSNGGMP